MEQPASDSLTANVLLDTLAEGEMDLPIVDGITTEVIGIAQSENGDAARLSSLIHRDPALAGEIVRIANSAAYRPRVPIGSLQQAIARLGLRTVAEVALGLSARDKLFRVPGYDQVVRAAWRYSAIAAAYAKEIARARRRNVETAFLCALLHDVGRPLALAKLVQLAAKRRESLRQERLLAIVDEVHQRVGAMLAEKWNLPASVQASIAHHHDEVLQGAEVDAIATTQLASALAELAGEEAAESPESKETQESKVRNANAISQLNLYPETVDILIGWKQKACEFAEVLS